MTKYCEGLDCAICNQKEPCIYKIANELQEENEELRQVRKDLPDIQTPYVILYRQLKKENNNLKHENEELKELIKQALTDFSHEVGTPYYDRLEEKAKEFKIGESHE